MPRHITRSERMDTTFVFRCTEQDRAELKLASQKMGMDMSGFIRYILIKEKVITPV